MKVLLLKHISKTGRKYEVKEVANGFALNHLIPQGLAVPATDSNIKKHQQEKDKHESEKAIQEDLLEKNIESLNDKEIVITAKASEKGHLFAGIHDIEIVKLIKDETNIEVPVDCLDLRGSIKTIGDHIIEVKAGKSVAKINIKVEPEEE